MSYDQTSQTTYPLSTTEPGPPPTPKDPALIYLSAPITVPAGAAGELSIVLTGPQSEKHSCSNVPVVVRNNTNGATPIEVTGTARSADGTLLASGTTGFGGMEPVTVQPGEWAMGEVAFCDKNESGYPLRVVTIPPGAKLDLTANAKPPSRLVPLLQLTVSQVRMTTGQDGYPRVVGTLTNNTGKPIGGGTDYTMSNGHAALMCFSRGTPTGQFFGGSLNLTGPTPFDINFDSRPPCPAYAIGAYVLGASP